MEKSPCVETVRGPMRVTELGRTLTHEHLALDFHKFYVPPPSQLADYFLGEIDLENVGFVKQYPYSSEYNINFSDHATNSAVMRDVELYKKFGGGTIVDNTSHGLHRDVRLMEHISEETGVNIIVGTGHYVAISQQPQSMQFRKEHLYNLIIKEMIDGCEEYREVKAGIIGEVGSSWPMHEFERSAILAAAHAQSQLSAPVTFHPGRNSESPFEIMRIYLEAGGQAKRAIMSHLDRTFTTEDELLEFAKIGTYCQYDLFGLECSLYQLDDTTDMPSDAQRLDRMKLLRDEGYLDKILMSHDIHTKHRLVEFGGHGYAHIINNVFPKMESKGFTQEEIDIITIENPKTWLSGPKVI